MSNLYKPSQKKIKRLSQKGDTPRSREFSQSGGFLGSILAAWVVRGQCGEIFARLSELLFRGATDGVLAEQLLQSLAWQGITLLLIVSAGGLIGTVLFDIGHAGWSLRPLQLREWSQFTQGALKLLGLESARQGEMRTTAPASLLCWWGTAGLFAVLLWFAYPQLALLLNTAVYTGEEMLGASGRVLLTPLLLIGGVLLILGTVDLSIVRSRWTYRQSMDRKEMVDENKEDEGNPELKSLRTHLHRELSMNQLSESVRKADVVVVS